MRRREVRSRVILTTSRSIERVGQWSTHHGRLHTCNIFSGERFSPRLWIECRINLWIELE
jgi:hypothetical protein